MAELDPKIETALDAESTLTAITGDRYYNDQLPQNPTYPCIVYTIFIDSVHTLDNDSDEALVQFDLFGTKDQVISMRGPLRTAMDNATGFKALFNSHQSRTPDDDLDISREIIDFRVWYNR